MELRCGGVGSQAVGRRMDGDSRDGGGGGGCKDAGSEDYENLPTSASLSTHMTAGAMAGILEHTVMYPIDSVKVRHEETLGTERAERERACVRLHPVQTHPEAAPRNHALPAPRRPESIRELACAVGALGSAPCGSFRPGAVPPPHPEPTRVPSAHSIRALPPRSWPGLRRGRSGEQRWPRWRQRGSRGRRSVQLCGLTMPAHATQGF